MLFMAAMTVHAPPASAAPGFVGPEEWTALAEEVWPELERCARRPGWAAATVQLVPDAELDATGLAFYDSDGLDVVRLRPGASRWTIMHELAHAWGNTGSAALKEGVAEALVACATQSRRTLCALQDRRPDPSIDLMTWNRRCDAHGYDNARVLIELALEAIPFDVLLDGDLEWRRFWGLVVEIPDQALRERIVRQMGPSWFTLDVDYDGVSHADERRRGTDPYRWDADGDGWWDGARARRSRVPVGFEWQCIGVARRTADVVLEAEGPAATQGAFELRVAGEVVTEHAHGSALRLAPGQVLEARWAVDGPAAVGGVMVKRPRGLGPCGEGQVRPTRNR